MNGPLVSVFIPYYNDSQFLRDSIESVLNQSYKNFELILLNHASTDNSRAIAHAYNDKRIKHIDMLKNLGAGSAVLMEEYLKIAQGKYAKLFCADDIMLPNCLETLVRNMEQNPNIDIIWADMEYVNEKQKSLKTKWSLERPYFSFEYNETDVLKKLFDGIGFLPYPSSIIKMDILKNIQKDPTFIMLVDMNIWAKALIQGAKTMFINDVVCKYRIHKNQTASSVNKNKVWIRSYFESIAYIQTFNQIKDVSLIKELCKYVPFIDELTQKDEEFFPFVLAYNNLNVKRPDVYRSSAYLYIHSLLLDPEKSKKLEDRFGFGIKEFRDLYSVEVKMKKAPKDLGVAKLIYLLLLRILKKITLRDLFEKKKYTE